ncbi:MAG: hypothetical protein Kow0031_37240 [Anaerolineae bacterium]
MQGCRTGFTKFTLTVLLVVAWLLAACGGDSAPAAPPAEDAPAQAEPAAPPADSAEVAPAEAPALDGVPAATVARVAALLNLRSLALPEGAAQQGQPEVGSVTVEAPLPVKDAVDYYRGLMSGQGWQEAEGGYADETAAALYFTKDGFALSLTASEMGDGRSGITLLHHGNINPNTLPQTADAETGFAAPNMFMFFSPTAVADVARLVRTELAARGWREYTRPDTLSADDPNSQIRTFVQNGLELTAYISTAPAQDNKTAVQYTLLLLPLDLPLEPGADAVELEKNPPYLRYHTAAAPEAVADFYRQQMTGLGWEEVADSAIETAEQTTLYFADTAGELALQLLLVPDNNRTNVTLLAPSAAPLADSGDDTAESDSGEMAEVETDAAPAGGIPAVPLPDDAAGVNFDPDTGEVTFTSATDLADLAEFYRQEMTALGWEEDTFLSMESESFASLDFAQGDETVTFIAFDIAGSIEATLDVSSAPSLSGMPAGESGDDAGIAAEPPADAPTTTINDWPVPPDATEVDLSGETLKYKVAMPLADLVEFYRPTFEELGLGTSCLDNAAEYTSISCSSSDGYVTLNFFAFEGFDDTEVEINFSNSYYPVDGGASGGDSGELRAEEQDGLPMPSDNSGYGDESTEYSRRLTVTSPSDIPTLLAFYQTELAALGWQEEDSTTDGDATVVTFSGPDGNLTLTLRPSGGETEAVLASKNPAAAEAAGVLPPAGQARLFLVNFAEEGITVTVNNQKIDVAAGAGMDSPDTAPSVDLPPGSYTVSFAIGGQSFSDSVEVGPDEAWGLLLDAQGLLPLQIY